MTPHDVLLLLACIVAVITIGLLVIWYLREDRWINAKYGAQRQQIVARYVHRLDALRAYRVALDRRQRGVGSADEVVAAYHAVLTAYSERETDGQDGEG